MTSLEPGPGVASDESNKNLHSNSVSPSCHGASDSFEHILGTLVFFLVGGAGAGSLEIGPQSFVNDLLQYSHPTLRSLCRCGMFENPKP